MPSMAIDRRLLLAGLTAGPLLPLLPRAGRARGTAPTVLSARGDAAGGFFVSGFDRDGALRFDLPLPARGHAVIVRPGGGEAVVFARRPGTFALALDLHSGTARAVWQAVEGRHFYGHGAFAADGRTLFATENDYENGRGVIGLYDAAQGYRRVGELPSHGIGPHDIRLLSDGRTLAVANGGIVTHPESGRAKLNLPEMAPSLTYVDSVDGTLLAEHRLPAELHRLSIRHLAVAPDDRVAVALQYEGPRGDLVPLVGLQRGDRAIALLAAPPAVQRAMRNYCGSACLDSAGRVLGVSSPRGNVATFWALADARFLGHTEVEDGCGIAASGRPGGFVITGGTGRAYLFDVGRGEKTPVRFDRGAFAPGAGPLWDNHATVTAG